jgi:GT2 family glycosyltransferase
VRVGIVSWNTADLLEACLAALPAALDGVEAEVVVVDNASADNSAAVARRHPVRVIVNDENLGYAVGMNQALGGSDAPLLLALNPDTIPAPGTLRRLVERMADLPHAGVLVPRLTDERGRPQDSAHRFPGPLVPIVAALSTRSIRRSRFGRWLLLDGSGPHRGGRVDWAIGAVHLIRADALAGESPYDERSFMYAEDLDLCWRLTQRGAPTMLAEDVSVAHVGNAAGEQAWGDQRSVRFWTATYDVIKQRRSPVAARVAAIGASVAGIVSILRTFPRAVMGARREQAGRLLAVRRRELTVHLRTAVAGPRPSPTSPPAA